MICYMPFSFIEDETIRKLTSAVGPVTVYGPGPAMVPDHMQTWAQDGLLHLRYPRGLKQDALSRAMIEFKAWADLHRGEIADMAAFFKSRGAAPPLVDENQPTRIGDQIRHYGESADGDPAGALFQAALFLAMAQEYDHHNDAVAKELKSLLDMEKDMLTRLSGDQEGTLIVP